MTVVSESIVTFGHVVAAACPPGAPTCDCVTSSPADPTTIAGPCRSRSITVEVPAGRSWWWIRTVEDILPCDEAVSGNEYVATWTCVDPLCCTLGDSNLDGTIDFADLIIMLSNWGPCPD